MRTEHNHGFNAPKGAVSPRGKPIFQGLRKQLQEAAFPDPQTRGGEIDTRESQNYNLSCLETGLHKEEEMVTQGMRRTVVAVIVVGFMFSLVPCGAVRADSLHAGGQRDRGNIMPAGRVDTGLVAGGAGDTSVAAGGSSGDTLLVGAGPVNTGIVSGVRHGRGVKVAAADVAKAAAGTETETTVQPATDEENRVIADALGTATAETQGASARPDHVLVRMYDANGKFIGFRSEKITYDENGRITSRNITTYDSQGKKTGTRTIDYAYTLDDEGRVTKTTVTNKRDGKTVTTSEHTFTYNDKGRVVERTAVFKDAKGNVIRNVVQTNTINDEGQVAASTIVRKDKEGHLIETVNITNKYDDNGTLLKQTSVTRDRAGNKTRVSVIDYKDGIAQSGVTRYFDRSGKLVKKEFAKYS
ncbi:MAG: hypothetical protein PHT59_08040 [Candidatus Omnitrophica bacterium]|nr:hypothetical protein [Candidatus Omnitrophota bacterium]